MALDGIVISNIVAELNSTILNSKISKIAEPEAASYPKGTKRLVQAFDVCKCIASIHLPDIHK